VDQKYSGLLLDSSGMLANSGIITAMRGYIYIDRETRNITRLIYDADGIPYDFPTQESHTVVDYGYIVIGAEKVLLPVRSIMRTVMKDMIYRNVTEFTNYRKFTSEVKIEFGKQ
jgi:hypothetical protein